MAEPYLTDFTALYGSDVLNHPTLALQRMGQAIAAYETESSEFHPFTSKCALIPLHSTATAAAYTPVIAVTARGPTMT